MKETVVAYFSGLIFALGLGLAGMTQPQKIIAFLNIKSGWNPALLLVMATAVFINGVAYYVIKKRRRPILAQTWHPPKHTELSKSMFLGAFLFGIGWALSGFCPGPAFVSIVSLHKPVLIFVSSMITGMFIFSLYDLSRGVKI